MRGIGLVLVAVGAIALAASGFVRVGSPPAAPGADAGNTPWASPVLGGIVVVVGLLVLLTNAKRE